MVSKLHDMEQLNRNRLSLKVNLESHHTAGKHQNKSTDDGRFLLTNAEKYVTMYITIEKQIIKLRN